MATATVHQRTRTDAAPYALSIEAAGFLTLLIGAWAAIVPYVAPTFGYSADATASWTWNLAHTELFLLPGAVAAFAGLLIMIEGMSTGPPRRAMLGFAGLLAALSGAWLLVGPFAWPVLEGPAFFGSGASSTRELIYWVMYSLGTGGLTLALGAFVLGRPRSSWPASASSTTRGAVVPQPVDAQTVTTDVPVAP